MARKQVMPHERLNVSILAEHYVSPVGVQPLLWRGYWQGTASRRFSIIDFQTLEIIHPPITYGSVAISC